MAKDEKAEVRTVRASIKNDLIVSRIEEAVQKYGGTMTAFVEECFMEGYQTVIERKERLFHG